MQQKETIRFIELLRGPAALFVVWDHLVAVWLDGSGKSCYPLRMVREYITAPLGIIQDFGFFGVALFFLISGYIITHTAQKDDRKSFAIKRFLRIYPPLILSLFLIFIVSMFDPGHAFANSTFKDYIWASTLFNYFKVNQNPINRVAGTLAIEILFYIFCIVLLTQIKKKPRIASLLSTLICVIFIFCETVIAPDLLHASVIFGFIPFLLMGQLIYFLICKRINFGFFAALSAANLAVFYFSDIYKVSPFTPRSYLINFLYAYLVFVFSMLINKWLDDTKLYYRTIAFFSKISYSLYLNHAYFGMVMLSILVPVTKSYFFSLMAVAAATIGYSYLSYRYVEEPSRKLARKIISPNRKPVRVGSPLKDTATL